MGCDIHLYKERFVDGRWLSADTWVLDKYDDSKERMEVPYEKRFTDRNYNLFGVLAGVREEFEFSLTPRGIPFDVSELVKKSSDDWDADGHSHSYLYLHELKALSAFLKTKTIKIEGMKDADQLAKLKESMATENPDYSLLYPYCGWSSMSSYVQFEIDIPASYIVGDAIDRIIELFKDVDGTNHRIVFWFDN